MTFNVVRDEENAIQFALTQSTHDPEEVPQSSKEHMEGTAQTVTMITMFKPGPYQKTTTVAYPSQARDTIMYKMLFEVDGVEMTRRQIFKAFGNRQARKMMRSLSPEDRHDLREATAPNA
jgi:hypothetical protein